MAWRMTVRRWPAPAGRVADLAPAADASSALERFLSHLDSRNASGGTVVEYRRHVTEFLAFLAASDVDWRTPPRATVRAYLAGLADRQLAASSVGGRLAAVRSFYRHAVRQGWINGDPLAGVRSPRRPGRLPRVLSVDDAARLVEAPARRAVTTRRGVNQQMAQALARRDGALLELLYATGMRISEVVSLTIDRLDLAAPAPASGRQGFQGARAALRPAGTGCRQRLPGRRTAAAWPPARLRLPRCSSTRAVAA